MLVIVGVVVVVAVVVVVTVVVVDIVVAVVYWGLESYCHVFGDTLTGFNRSYWDFQESFHVLLGVIVVVLAVVAMIMVII